MSKKKIPIKKLKSIIKKSGLFDKIFYLRTYADARRADELPLDHFIKYGLEENRKPNEYFDPVWYRKNNVDVKNEDMNPFIHYVLYGLKEDRKPNEDFDPIWYKEYYEDVKENGSSAFQHYFLYGRKEGRLQYNPNKSNNQKNNIFELTEELKESLKKIFDEENYLKANADIQAAVEGKIVESGWEHFIQYGIEEVRKGERVLYANVPLMSEEEYISNNEDIEIALKDGIILSAFEHFLLSGAKEYMDGTRILSSDNEYIYHQPILTDSIQNEIQNFQKKPLISVVMPVYNVDPKWLRLAVESLENQWYDNWEICIADDKSTNQETVEFLKSLNDAKIKIVFMEKNQNISGASNEALKLASGEFIALMDNDDELTADALYEVVKAINEQNAEFIYSDEDKLELDGTYSEPHFKPDFAPDMFLSQNYLSHLGVIKKELIDKVGGWSIGLEGAQDYDLYLKVLEHTDKIVHISKVLYHWRKIPGSTAAEFSEKSYAQEAGRKALENAMQRRNIIATAKNGLTNGTYKVDYKIVGEPLVSIIVPFKDKPELLKMCVESILNKSTYRNFEIIGISNNSEGEETFSEMKRLESLDKRVHFYEYNVPFNYSDINNYAVKTYANGEHIIFLNNDIEIITPSWIEELLMYSQQENVGAVGAKLYFPNDTIQHAGLVLAPFTDHSIMSIYRTLQKDEYGYVSRAKCVNNYLAVTAACLMCKKNLFLEVNSFDEKENAIAYNDVDLCLNFYEKGYRNVWTPYCEAYHYESVSRGYEESLQQIERREQEKFFLKKKHQVVFENYDPCYNKNLSRFSDDFSIDGVNTNNYLEYSPIEFTEHVIVQINYSKKSKNNITIFSHFDKDNSIKEYVLYYLEQLSQFSDIIFVSTASKLSTAEIDKLNNLCRDVIVKENYGYDFGAWKTGLNCLGSELDDYESLILCNDSVFGPFYDLEEIFNTMQNKNLDFWSMTDNQQIAYHLQSFFIVYNQKALKSSIFKDFWDNFKIYKNKQILIENNEIKFSQKLQKSDLKYGAYVPSSELNSYLNISHYYWDNLIKDYKFPFIKKELLRDNPMNIDISKWREVIKNSTRYDISLIESGSLN